MKTFLLDIIPRIQRFSQQLDNSTLLTNKHWVVIDEELNEKVVFIFREKENQLLISENGRIEKGTWEYLGNNSLLIDKKDGSYLFKHGFIDDTVLALKVDGRDEYALLVNEHKFENHLNSLNAVLEFLDNKYSNERALRVLTIPETRLGLITEEVPTSILKVSEVFDLEDFPNLVEDVENIRNKIQDISDKFVSEILISFCRDYAISNELFKGNTDLCKRIVNEELPIGLIKELFRINKSQNVFIEGFERYLNSVFN